MWLTLMLQHKQIVIVNVAASALLRGLGVHDLSSLAAPMNLSANVLTRAKESCLVYLASVETASDGLAGFA